MIKRNQITYFSRDKIEYSRESLLGPYIEAVEYAAFESIISVEQSLGSCMSFSGQYSNFFGNISKTNEEDV